MILAYITRGVAPVRLAIDARDAATLYGWRWKLIDGQELVAAKNAAADYALEWEDDLLMVEDDMLVPPEVWHAVSTPVRNVIMVADTNMRNGISTIRETPAKKLLYSGTCFVKIPIDTLCKLEKPVFQAHNFGRTSDGYELFPKGPNERGTGSDTWLWYHLGKLDPAPEFRVIGKVGHVKHPMNSEAWEHRNPYVMETF